MVAPEHHSTRQSENILVHVACSERHPHLRSDYWNKHVALSVVNTPVEVTF